MMYAPIVPTKILSQAEVRNRPFQFALAQYVLSDKEYAGFIANQTTNTDAYTILDNGVAEGVTLPWERVLVAGNTISADEIVLPDVFRDAERTLASVLDKSVLDSIRPYHRAVVPQGSTWDEWEYCLHTLLKSMEFRTLMIPKHLERLPGGRAHAMQIVMRAAHLHTFQDIHMLGFYDKPLAEVSAVLKVFPNVRSWDSGVAVAHAQCGEPIHDREHRSLNWERVLNVDHKLVRANIRQLDFHMWKEQTCYLKQRMQTVATALYGINP